MNPLVSDTIETLKEFSSSERIELARRICPTRQNILGVIVPDIKKVLKELKVVTNDFTAREKIELAISFVDTHILECQQLAYDYLDNNRKVLSHLTVNDLQLLGQDMDNWVSTDGFGTYILGAAWRMKVIDINHIKGYVSSPDIWLRRVGVVSTVALNQKARGGKGDSTQTIAICKLVVNDHEDMVVKALSWALRVLSGVDRMAVEEFLGMHGSNLHKRVIREVRNKLDKGKKN